MASIADLLGVQWDNQPSGNYTLHPHAERQIKEKGFDRDAVLRAANDPGHTSENRRYPGQLRHVRDGMVAVVEPKRGLVVTAYQDQVETSLRPDQKDKDAQAYGRKQRSA